MSLRLLAMGAILSVLGVALLASRGVRAEYGGLLLVGVALFVAGVALKRAAR